jgi:Protein of unknown function (DUF2975)
VSNEVGLMLAVDKKLLFINKYLLMFAKNKLTRRMGKASLPAFLRFLFTLLFWAEALYFTFVVAVSFYPNLIKVLLFQKPTADSGTKITVVRYKPMRVGNRTIYVEKIDTTSMNPATYSPSAPLIVTTVRQVDSVFTANLDVDVVMSKDGYIANRFNTGISQLIQLPLGGHIEDRFLSASTFRDTKRDPAHTPFNPWHRRLKEFPTVSVLEKPESAGDYLQFLVRSQEEWKQVPISLRLPAYSWAWLWGLGLLGMTYQFMKLFQHIADNSIFTLRQVWRVQFIGIVCLLYVIIDALRQWYSISVARQYVVDLGYRAELLFYTSIWQGITIQWLWILMGLCILALAQVFKYGMQLKQENELTI